MFDCFDVVRDRKGPRVRDFLINNRTVSLQLGPGFETVPFSSSATTMPSVTLCYTDQWSVFRPTHHRSAKCVQRLKLGLP
jgi:hypothetical protein